MTEGTQNEKCQKALWIDGQTKLFGGLPKNEGDDGSPSLKLKMSIVTISPKKISETSTIIRLDRLNFGLTKENVA
jgi:hypothetical protein